MSHGISSVFIYKFAFNTIIQYPVSIAAEKTARMEMNGITTPTNIFFYWEIFPFKVCDMVVYGGGLR